MIELRPHRVDSIHKTPILSRWEMDEYAHAVLKDYKPDLLRYPGTINYQHFLESYLGLEIEFQDIYDDDPERPILAMIAFERGAVRVFDEESGKAKRIIVSERTVILDNLLTQEEKKGLALFSGLHEGFHYLLHKDFFSGSEENSRGDLPGEQIKPVMCCRRENIESFGKRKKERTAAEWLEYQADYSASALAMPNATFTPFINGILRENGYRRGSIILGRDSDLDILAQDILPDAIMDTYGVSRRAAKVKLSKNEVVISVSAVR
jgi:hypothetical protein